MTEVTITTGRELRACEARLSEASKDLWKFQLAADQVAHEWQMGRCWGTADERQLLLQRLEEAVSLYHNRCQWIRACELELARVRAAWNAQQTPAWPLRTDY